MVKKTLLFSILVCAIALPGAVAAQSPEEESVQRAFRRIEALVNERAALAERTANAGRLVDAASEARKQGRTDAAGAALAEALQMLDAVSGDRGMLTQEVMRRLAAEQQMLAPPVPVPAELPRKQLARYNVYRDSIARILREESLPAEAMSVAVVESGLNPMALSPKGARGLWQLMPETARRYGLIVAPENDHRLHPESATRAAARYLRDLYRLFGDWKLALAAYNAGEGRVERAILRAGVRDFDELSRRGLLPLETRNYVPAVLAAWRRMKEREQ